MWGTVIVIIIIAWLMQAFFTYLQISNYRKKIRELKHKGKIGIGKVSKKLGIGTIIFLVSNDCETVVDAEKMSGISVFARFKKDEELIGHSIEELEEMHFRSKSKQEAVEKALDNLKVQFDQ